MGIISWGKDRKELKALKALGTLQRNNIAASLNRNLAVYPTYDIGQNADRFANTDDLYSIIRMLYTTCALIPIFGYVVKDEKQANKLNKLRQPHSNIFQTKALQIKALEELPDNDKLNLLLENPHQTLSKFEWLEYIYLFLLVDGECFILKEKPESGVNAGTTVNTHFLYPKNVILKVSDTFPRRIVGYDYRVNGVLVYENLDPGDVIHIKMPNPASDYSGSELRGLSPIQVLLRRLAMLDSNTDVITAQMQNGGVETIVYDKSPSDERVVEITGQRKDNFYRFLNNPSNAGAPFFASGEMGVLHIGSELDKLKVIENAQMTFKKLCNVFGTSDVLFNNDTASTESNVEEMTKRTYTNTVLPLVYRVRDALKKGLLADLKDGRYVSEVDGDGNINKVFVKGDGITRDIREDISEIPELQENSKAMAEWLAIAWWVTPNQKLEMMKFERNLNPMFDQPLIPSGLQTLEDLQMAVGLPGDNVD